MAYSYPRLKSRLVITQGKQVDGGGGGGKVLSNEKNTYFIFYPYGTVLKSILWYLFNEAVIYPVLTVNIEILQIFRTLLLRRSVKFSMLKTMLTIF